MKAHFFRLLLAYACTQRSSLYGGRRRGAFGLAGFPLDRSANPASSVTLLGGWVTDSNFQGNPTMPARHRVVRAKLRARLALKRRQLDDAFHELESCQVALHGAAGAIPSSMDRGMLSEEGAYELLLTLHQRLYRAIDQLRQAAGQEGVA